MQVEVHSQVHSMQQQLDLIAKQIDRSLKQPMSNGRMLRDLALEIVRGCPQHGILGEHCQIGRVFHWVKANIEYRHDPQDYDLFMTARRTIEAGGSDCFALDTSIIVKSRATGCYEVRTLGELRNTWPAYDALTYDFSNTQWTFRPITAWTSKGIRETHESHLGNGPAFRHTEDHRVWWYDGQSGRTRVVEGSLGSRFDEERSNFRRALVAQKIPALNTQDYPKDLAYITGIYAAEGYASVNNGKNIVSIAQDKIDIREKIEKALSSYGVPFAKSKRDIHSYYNIHASQIKDLLVSQGTNSFNMGFDQRLFGSSEQAIREALEAHADGDAYKPKEASLWFKKVHGIHATSSRKLAEQLQLMLMILGEPWHTQLQLFHGGAGNSPIYRIHRWKPETLSAQRLVPELPGVGFSHLRPSSPFGEEEVADITVADTHNFVLSNGLIAHNCDDHLVLVCSLLNSIGFRTGAKVISPDGAAWHIYALAATKSHLPPHNPIIVALDTTQVESYPGWEPGMQHRKYEYVAVFKDGRATYRKVRN